MTYNQMMSSEPRYRPVPLHRRWMNDLVHFGKKSHVMGYAWRINIAPLVEARTAAQPAIGWTAHGISAFPLGAAISAPRQRPHRRHRAGLARRRGAVL
jgi:hypothetical protein